RIRTAVRSRQRLSRGNDRQVAGHHAALAEHSTLHRQGRETSSSKMLRGNSRDRVLETFVGCSQAQVGIAVPTVKRPDAIEAMAAPIVINVSNVSNVGDVDDVKT